MGIGVSGGWNEGGDVGGVRVVVGLWWDGVGEGVTTGGG